MNVASRPVATGKTRTCPHCKAVILESLTICPGCLHHLRFDSDAAKRQVAANTALRVEGVIRHPPLEEPWEYYVVIAIRNDRGEEVTRQVVNVGALQPSEKRTFALSVEVLPPQAPAEPETLEMIPAASRAPVQAPVAAQKPAQPQTPAQAAGLRPPQPGTPAPRLGSGSKPSNPAAVVRPAGEVPPKAPHKQPAAPGAPSAAGSGTPGAARPPQGPGAPAPQTPAQKAGLKPPPPMGGGGPKRH